MDNINAQISIYYRIIYMKNDLLKQEIMKSTKGRAHEGLILFYSRINGSDNTNLPVSSHSLGAESKN